MDKPTKFFPKSSAVLGIENHVLWLQIPKDYVPVAQGLQSKKQ